jgi:hypothetical protein
MLSTDESEFCQNTDNMWDKAIYDAENQLEQAKRRIGRLETAIRIFKENKVNGVPWPSTVSPKPD